MDPASLESRAGELGLRGGELATWQPRLTDGVVASLLTALIRYEDALAELAATKTDADGAAPR